MSDKTPPVSRDLARGGGRLLRGLRGEGMMIWAALAVLVVACLLVEPSTLHGTALLSMLPFAAILAIASIGQGLTIQQAGLDFSVQGSIALSAVLVTGIAAGQNSNLPEAIVLSLAVVAGAGLLNGIAITVFKITPIIATLGVNALLLGGVQSYAQTGSRQASANLASFMVNKSLGVPNTVWVALAFIVVAGIIVNATVVGRRFVAIGANPATAQASGLPVRRYVITTYVLAAICYGAAGIVLAGYITTPNTSAGDPYLLSTITAVVVGGTALGGGRGRLVGTAAAAVFLSQLNVFLSATGAPGSVTYLVQSAAIAIAAAFASVAVGGFLRRRVRRPAATGDIPT